MTKRIWLFVLLLTASVSAQAHTRLKPNASIVPRSTNPGIKQGPCGVARGTSPAQLTGGQTITVEWEETIQHPGRFEIYFSQAGDANFQMLKMVNDDQNGTDTPHQFSTTVTLPNVTCTDCTLQLIQVMTENPASPSYYYSCADMVVNAASVVPTSTPQPPVTTTPSSGTPLSPASCP